MNIVKIEKLIEEIKSLSKSIESIDTVLESEYYPESVDVTFKFEDAEDTYVSELISLHASVYMEALRKQKDFLIKKLNYKKIELSNETEVN